MAQNLSIVVCLHRSLENEMFLIKHISVSVGLLVPPLLLLTACISVYFHLAQLFISEHRRLSGIGSFPGEGGRSSLREERC